MTKDEVKKRQRQAKELFDKAGIFVTGEEKSQVE